MIRNQPTAPPPRRRSARAIAATRQGEQALIARAASLGVTLLLGIAAMASGVTG